MKEKQFKCRDAFKENFSEIDNIVTLKLQGGITLIALVLTIIILLILAGVTISIVFNGGIINKSQTAVEAYHIQEDKEKIELAKAEVSFNNLGEIPVEELKEALIKYKFTICDDITEFEGETLTEKQFVVKCPNNKHMYLVTAEKITNSEEKTKPQIESISVENEKINLFDDVTTTFTANITGKGDYTLQWYYENEAIEGATNEIYKIATAEMNEKIYLGGTYKCILTYEEESSEKEASQTVEYTISNAEQMSNFAKRVNNQEITFATLKEKGGEVTLTTDIDLSTICGSNVDGKEINWTPIGSIGQPFAGTFNGNNHKVSNLYINDTEEIWGRGLFAAFNGEILNLGVENVNITTKDTQFVGGISGAILGNAKIEKCYSTGYINGNIGYAGGIIGGNWGETNNLINKCYSKINIKSISRTGGIIGLNKGTVSNCYNLGEIESGDYVGGIVGINTGNINNCYNSANINAFSSRVGGITGTLYPGYRIVNSYNIGKISDNVNYSGAIIGAGPNNGLGIDGVENCYYLVGTSTQPGTGSTDVAGQAEAKTGTYMKSSEFVNLLGNSNWKLAAGANKGYPILSWQEGTPITVNNYDIYYNGIVSKSLTNNEFTGWSYKGTIEYKENNISLLSNNSNALNILRTTDKLNLTNYNTIVIRKTNVNLTRLYFVTGNLNMVNQEIVPFTFASKNAINVGNDTWVCDIKDENYEGWLEISTFCTDNDGEIYEIYLSSKTLEQIKSEY